MNKVLWSGGWYMANGQNITLSEAVTEQPHGVVLVWSEYSNEAGQDAGWSYFFVPKYHVSATTSGGVNCSTAHYGNSSTMAKYVYVRTTQILGNSLNTTSANNSKFILRYVLGV